MARTETIAATEPGAGPASPTLGEPGGRPRAYYAEILIASFAGLLLEISLTRVMSFKLFYYYTYFVIGLALLGIGTGGVLVSVSKRLRTASTEAVLMWSLLLGAAGVAVGYVVVATASLDTFAIWRYTASSVGELGMLLVVCLALFAAFVPIGVIISTLFGRRPEQVGRLYFADLVGAGLACAIVVSLIGSIGPPATIFLAGLALALAGLRLAVLRVDTRRRPLLVGVAAAVALIVGIGAFAPDELPGIRPDATKENLAHKVAYSDWSPIFRVDVVPLPNPDVIFLYHDGIYGSGFFRWDGKQSSLAKFKWDNNADSLPFKTAGRAPRNEMIIGAAGGHEILPSLYYGAHHVDAVELNPVTYSLVRGKYADYVGRLAENPRVNYVNTDGRSYLARSDKKYDLVWYPAPDSYSATNASTASAFVLSESYLYTSDAIVDSLDHLRRGGLLATQFGEFDYPHKPTRTSRYVATARHALADLGIKDPSRHILVANEQSAGPFSLSTILVKRTPFTDGEVARFTGALPNIEGTSLQYAPGRTVPSSAVSNIVSRSSSSLASFYDSYKYDVRPITDDGPFFWHFTSFRKVISNYLNPLDTSNDRELYVGERVLLLLLVLAAILAAVFLLLPFVVIRHTWLQLPRKGLSALYFFAIGLGFFLFEIVLIQRLVLFLGYPTHSLTVTLMSLLLFTGVGALLSGRLRGDPSRILPWLFLALAVLCAFYLFGLPVLTDALQGLPLAGRVPVAFAVLAPLGLCLGLFMPLGVGAVAKLSDHPREYVAWGWAVNGFASVIGSVLTTIMAMEFGFRVVLVVALVVYGVALLTLRPLLRAAVAA